MESVSVTESLLAGQCQTAERLGPRRLPPQKTTDVGGGARLTDTGHFFLSVLGPGRPGSHTRRLRVCGDAHCPRPGTVAWQLLGVRGEVSSGPGPAAPSPHLSRPEAGAGSGRWRGPRAKGASRLFGILAPRS